MTPPAPITLTGPSTVLFDLDGTLIDSADGILWSFGATLREFGRPVDETVLRTFIGPPLDYSFSQLGFGPDEMADVLARYRVHYRDEGVRRCHLYDGVTRLLEDIADTPVSMGVATAKRVDFAYQILEDLGIDSFFRVVAGASLDGQLNSKDVIVANALSRMDLDPAGGWLVGDRRFDVAAAKSHGLTSIGVTWGYGAADELRQAGADWLVDHPSDLATLLTGALAHNP